MLARASDISVAIEVAVGLVIREYILTVYTIIEERYDKGVAVRKQRRDQETFPFIEDSSDTDTQVCNERAHCPYDFGQRLISLERDGTRGLLVDILERLIGEKLRTVVARRQLRRGI